MGTQGFLQHRTLFQKQFHQEFDGLQAKAYSSLDYTVILRRAGTSLHHTQLAARASVTPVDLLLAGPCRGAAGTSELRALTSGEQRAHGRDENLTQLSFSSLHEAMIL